MSKTIWKAVLQPGERNAVHLDVDGKIVNVIEQEGRVTLYFETEAAPMRTHDRFFYVVGTGQHLPQKADEYIGTVRVPITGFVWHVYSEKEPVVE